jgi:hypothetical protein
MKHAAQRSITETAESLVEVHAQLGYGLRRVAEKQWVRK